jgi:hypothetical protein
MKVVAYKVVCCVTKFLLAIIGRLPQVSSQACWARRITKQMYSHLILDNILRPVVLDPQKAQQVLMFRIYVEIIEDLFYVTCDSYVVSPRTKEYPQQGIQRIRTGQQFFIN